MRRLLRAVVFTLAAFSAGPVPAETGTDRAEVLRTVVEEALRSDRVPPSLALAVAEAESNFDADAESPAGARGVMQIMPATGRGEFGVEPDALWQPRLNVQIGIAFLDRLIDRYGERWDLALSHYNGGSRVGYGAAARVIPATRGYVDKVLRLERRNARDETVRLLVAAAEEAIRPRVAVVRPSGEQPSGEQPSGGRPPAAGPSDRAVAAARPAAIDPGASVGDWRPAEPPRRPRALAETALDGAGTRREGRGKQAGSGALLAGIELRRRRFRALLAALHDG